MANKTLVTFPDFTKELEIHTDAKRIPHTCSIGDQGLIRKGTENKYEAPSLQRPTIYDN